MRTRTLGTLACAILVLTGCGRLGDSNWNPMRWMGSSASRPASLEPQGGYATTANDGRMLLAGITGARWEPLYEGRLLVVTALASSKGWWKVALVPEDPMPKGRMTPDENGVLRLRLIGNPPPADTFEAANPANPASDTISVGLTLSNNVLSNLREVVVTSAGNSITLRP